MMRLGWLVGRWRLVWAVGWTGVGAGRAAQAGRPGARRGEGGDHRAEHASAVGNNVVTTIRVKNMSTAPIAGLKIEENWYKGNDAVGRRRVSPPAAAAGRRSDRDHADDAAQARIIGARNQYQFSHANGTIKTTVVKTLDLPKPAK